jgi:hypothetical protein
MALPCPLRLKPLRTWAFTYSSRLTMRQLIEQYGSNTAYYHYKGQPVVSTFEGPANAADWIFIKQQTGCFFVPDWSSLGAKAALEAGGGGIVDGLFSWAAWPWGDWNMNTYTDASYLQYFNETGTALPYLMPVSPWFYTNLPCYDKTCSGAATTCGMIDGRRFYLCSPNLMLESLAIK